MFECSVSCKDSCAFETILQTLVSLYFTFVSVKNECSMNPEKQFGQKVQNNYVGKEEQNK